MLDTNVFCFTIVVLNFLCNSKFYQGMDELNESSPIEKARFCDYARVHGIETIIYHQLKEKKADTLFSFEIESLREAHLKLAVLNVYRFEQLDSILKLLGDHQIPVIMLKGSYLAREVYDNLGMRSMSDVDLLVRKKDLNKVEGLLLSIDYEPENTHRVISSDNHHFAYRKEHRIRLEMHWILHQSHGMKIDMDGLWQRAHPLTHLPGRAYALCPEDMLLHLCLHMALHAYHSSLRMLYDIALMLEKFASVLDFPALCQRAKAWGVANSVYVGFFLAKELLCAKVPDSCLHELCPKGEVDSYITSMREHLLSFPDGSRSVSPSRAPLLFARSSWMQKVKLLGRTLFLPRKTMSLTYPASADSWKILLFYPLRWWDVFTRHSAMLFGALKGDKKAKSMVELSNNITDLQHWMLSGSSEDAHEE